MFLYSVTAHDVSVHTQLHFNFVQQAGIDVQTRQSSAISQLGDSVASVENHKQKHSLDSIEEPLLRSRSHRCSEDTFSTEGSSTVYQAKESIN